MVKDFRAQLPEADILVFDNASTDGSAERAREAGARVIREKRRGKGFVMQSVMEAVEADVCVIVDGDDTYFAEDVEQLLAPIRDDRADMVVGDRLATASSEALTSLHRFGNRVILGIINAVFGTRFKDILSGYRAINRNFIRSVPLITGGFETETELTLQALERGMVIEERPIRYRPRPEGSFSKLSPFADGYRILMTMAVLLRNHRPLYFFSLFSVALLALDLVYLAAWASDLLGNLPPAVHAAISGAIALVAISLVVFGVVLNAVTAGQREMITLNRRRGSR